MAERSGLGVARGVLLVPTSSWNLNDGYVLSRASGHGGEKVAVLTVCKGDKMAYVHVMLYGGRRGKLELLVRSEGPRGTRQGGDR